MSKLFEEAGADCSTLIFKWNVKNNRLNDPSNTKRQLFPNCCQMLLHANKDDYANSVSIRISGEASGKPLKSLDDHLFNDHNIEKIRLISREDRFDTKIGYSIDCHQMIISLDPDFQFEIQLQFIKKGHPSKEQKYSISEMLEALCKETATRRQPCSMCGHSEEASNGQEKRKK